MKPEARIVHTERRVIENKLLAALDDAAKVAIVTTREDLDLLIDGLAKLNVERARELVADMMKLREAAFPD